MIKNIKTEDLKVGMYVILPHKWLSHPFISNQFLINTETQIKKLIEAGIGEVSIDFGQSKLEGHSSDLSGANKEKTAKKTANHTSGAKPIIPPALQEAIYDTKMLAHDKALLVHKHSIVMINRLMDSPSVENIIEAKKGIAELVDLILADNNTMNHLLKITSHDYSTYVHSVNVGLLGISLSKKLFGTSSAHNIHELGAGFFLHDLGKVNVSIDIINKPSSLTDEEMLEMHRHPQYGYEILTKAGQLTQECKTIVLHHHENHDGSGYPLGLKGDDIHLYGRICALADVYDALNSERPYRRGLGTFATLKLMKEEMLTHFHKDLFKKFILLFS
jgi:HD-GYP domain-containing protein (c-di-GMP phosphodiesterase class II)